MSTQLFPTGLPLKGGQLMNIPGGASFADVVIILNDVIDQLNAQSQTQIYSDTTSKRMLIGYQKAGWDGGASDFGIKVSLPGIDVTQATDSQLLFSMGLTTWDWRNTSGVLVKKWDSSKGNETFYDPTSGLDIGQQGILPDASGGAVWAKPGDSVNSAYGV